MLNNVNSTIPVFVHIGPLCRTVLASSFAKIQVRAAGMSEASTLHTMSQMVMPFEAEKLKAIKRKFEEFFFSVKNGFIMLIEL
jgi:hypothetical protein